jgi:hypothetical protein
MIEGPVAAQERTLLSAPDYEYTPQDSGQGCGVANPVLAAARLGSTKCFAESSFVVVGTVRDRKSGGLRALLARPNSEGLHCAGAAFIAR